MSCSENLMTIKVFNSNQIKGSLQVLWLLVPPLVQHWHNAHEANWQILMVRSCAFECTEWFESPWLQLQANCWLKKRMNGLGIKKYCRRHSDSFCVCGRHQNRLYITSAIATTDLVTERWVIQRVQFVGDVFANEVPKHLIEKSICLQEVGEPLSRPTQKLAVLLSHNGHLKKKWHPSFDLKQGKCAGKCTYCTHYSCPTAAREDG